mmetsp:Transcript_49980/g.107118  ORF Transcript_49980/g.107118 Transcript_49980/m.107118 type:complete len:241 (+) Transcript_49980:2801-3523(+)
MARAMMSVVSEPSPYIGPAGMLSIASSTSSSKLSRKHPPSFSNLSRRIQACMANCFPLGANVKSIRSFWNTTRLFSLQGISTSEELLARGWNVNVPPLPDTKYIMQIFRLEENPTKSLTSFPSTTFFSSFSIFSSSVCSSSVLQLAVINTLVISLLKNPKPGVIATTAAPTLFSDVTAAVVPVAESDASSDAHCSFFPFGRRPMKAISKSAANRIHSAASSASFTAFLRSWGVLDICTTQ